jgi:hypothetical protein
VVRNRLGMHESKCHIGVWDAASRRIYVDGDAWTYAPWGNRWAGHTVYMCGPTEWTAIAWRYCRDGKDDSVAGPAKAHPECAKFEVDGGYVRLVSSDVWDLNRNSPEMALESLQARINTCLENDLRWMPSASGVAGRLVERVVRNRTKQLRPRWRYLAHSAIHPGPQVCLSGGNNVDAVHMDRVQAYLRALDEPVPVWDSWTSLRTGTWNQIRNLDGLINAKVSIPEYVGALPPLPTTRYGVKVWPAGIVTGTWPINWLRFAEETHNATVLEIYDCQVCRTADTLSGVSRAIRAIPDKQFRKLLYTRAWGRWASLGWYVASPFRDWAKKRMPIQPNDRVDGLWWVWGGKGLASVNCAPDYRPDWAAWVCANNSLAMLTTLSRMDADKTPLIHVDAIWSTDIGTYGHSNTDWQIKGIGPMRAYGIGCYQHGTEIHAMGWKAWEPPNEDTMRAWLAAGSSWGTAQSRAWDKSPALHADATSTPHNVKMIRRITSPLTDNYNAWTTGGWAR